MQGFRFVSYFAIRIQHIFNSYIISHSVRYTKLINHSPLLHFFRILLNTVLQAATTNRLELACEVKAICLVQSSLAPYLTHF